MTRVWTPWPRLITVAGLLTMIVAGVLAGNYTPFWFDPDEGCALQGRCVTPHTEAMLGMLWWVVLGGLVVVLVGLVMTWVWLPSTPRGTGPPRMSALAQAATAGTLCGLGSLVGVFGLLLAAFTAVQAGVAGLCLYVLLQGRLLAGLDRFGGPPERSPRGSWGLGMLASLVTVAASVGMVVLGRDWGAAGVLLPVVSGLAAAVVVLLGRLRPRRPSLVAPSPRSLA
ncbi:MAG TPA: hypothetical protein VI076_09320 [Actinopolymorphaceae bacterium]